MRRGIKRIVLIALVIACFVSFDCTMDYIARNYYHGLFNFVLYPVDFAGVIEYSIGATVLYLSNKKGIEWMSTGTIACFAYSFVIIVYKFVL